MAGGAGEVCDHPHGRLPDQQAGLSGEPRGAEGRKVLRCCDAVSALEVRRWIFSRKNFESEWWDSNECQDN